MESEVSERTSKVLLEAACFHPANIRRTSTRLKLRSEASARFERNISPEVAAHASARATKLLVELAGGRAAKGKADASMLDSVHQAMPAVMEAFQLTTKASRVGFDWPNATEALSKLDEEAHELRAALVGPSGPEAAEELGDLLFAAVNVARLQGVDPESALKAANRKFRRRFQYLEQRLADEGRKPADATLAEMDRLWDEAKSKGL